MSGGSEAEQGREDVAQEHDGTLAADDLLPPWWLAVFYLGIIAGAVYWFEHQQPGSAPSSSGEDVAAVAAQLDPSDGGTEADILRVIGDPAHIEAGRAIFATECAFCHGQHAEGVTGPNLTDDRWLRGGGAIDIHRTIAEGAPSAGMPAWGQALGRAGVLDVFAFVMSVRNTDVPGKPPQGEVVVDDDGGAGGAGATTQGAVREGASAPTEAPTSADGAVRAR